MRIIVLIKQVPDSEVARALDLTTRRLDRINGAQVIDEIDERALEVALLYKDGHKETQVEVLTMGDIAATDAVRRALAMGADSAVHVCDAALRGADLTTTALVLAAAVSRSNPELILAGNQSSDGGGGVIPAMLAAHLGYPLLSSLDTVAITESSVSGERSTETSMMKVHAQLPAVVSVTEHAAEPRFVGLKGLLLARRKPLALVTLSELGPRADALACRSSVVSIAPRRARQGGRKTVDHGNAGNDLAAFLAEEHLI